MTEGGVENGEFDIYENSDKKILGTGNERSRKQEDYRDKITYR